MYLKVFESIQKYSKAFKSMQTQVKICKSKQKYAYLMKKCKKVCFIKLSKTMQKHRGKIMQKYTAILSHASSFVI